MSERQFELAYLDDFDARFPGAGLPQRVRLLAAVLHGLDAVVVPGGCNGREGSNLRSRDGFSVPRAYRR